ATYYIEYAKDPLLGEPYSYFNEYTLDSWLNTDVFVEQVLPKLSTTLTAEELNERISLTVPSDVRVIQLTVTSEEPVLTMEILRAYDEALVTFAENQREINAIKVQDMPDEAYQIKADIRTQRAFVLGAVLGLFAGSMYLVLNYLLDDGIYLPETLKKRHGLKVLGADVSEELPANVLFAVKETQKVALTSVGDTPSLPDVLDVLKGMDPKKEWVIVPAMVQCPEAGEILRGCDGCILTVVSGADKSGAIERALHYYEQQQVKVIGSILWNADEKLLKRYGK
ncbi:MAG: hypothetical protein IKA09_05340, partial [Lachnospiraceae bacterium]|nr:hypothetical protein [Lachnospiraceae bacterium]